MRRHAIIQKKVINFDAGGRPLVCCWDECDRPATSIYKHTSCEHDVSRGCVAEDRRQFPITGQTAHLDFVFCSERHRAYFVNAKGTNALESIARTGQAYGNLPTGMRGRYG